MSPAAREIAEACGEVMALVEDVLNGDIADSGDGLLREARDKIEALRATAAVSEILKGEEATPISAVGEAATTDSPSPTSGAQIVEACCHRHGMDSASWPLLQRDLARRFDEAVVRERRDYYSKAADDALDNYGPKIDAYRKERDEARSRVAELEGALGFYADERNHHGDQSSGIKPVEMDYGKRARAALAAPGRNIKPLDAMAAYGGPETNVAMIYSESKSDPGFTDGETECETCGGEPHDNPGAGCPGSPDPVLALIDGVEKAHTKWQPAYGVADVPLFLTEKEAQHSSLTGKAREVAIVPLDDLDTAAIRQRHEAMLRVVEQIKKMPCEFAGQPYACANAKPSPTTGDTNRCPPCALRALDEETA